jgi:glutaminase
MSTAAGTGAADDPITDALQDLRRRLLPHDDGVVADYIPQLGMAAPDQFGLALVSMDGHVYQAGDCDVGFTIQSVSKPFVYALALADLGLDGVSARVGAEPSGEAFNAISLEPGTGRPANPMVNAGAIVTTSLVAAAGPAERFDRVLAGLSAFAGRQLEVDEQVYASEQLTGDRNRALSYLMRAAGALPDDVDQTLGVYFRQCAIRVTALDLAVMAATLAHGGINPLTGAKVVSAQVTEQVLAVMATCGMYDAAGDWLLRVGLPAKSGVSGGVIAASPARFGVATFSPPLDPTGSSVRGVAALRELARRFDLHLMHNPATATPTVTLAGTAAHHPSSRLRSRAERELLRREGERVAVVAAQGALDFTAAERLLHALSGRSIPGGAGGTTGKAGQPRMIVLDLRRVTLVEPAAAAMLRWRLARAEQIALVSDAPQSHDWATWPVFPDLDQAIAYCEDRLL